MPDREFLELYTPLRTQTIHWRREAATMANFLPKSLKDMRRRSVEYAFGALGSSDRTTDPEFDAHDINFKKTMKDLNECTC